MTSLTVVLPLPPNIPPEHGGPLTCALWTAYHAVVSRGTVHAGEDLEAAVLKVQSGR